MQSDVIEAIGIDEKGSLWVKPTTAKFPYIYREAMEVHWDAQRQCLYAPSPREWSHARWFEQILEAAREQSCTLKLLPTTSWLGVPAELQEIIKSLAPRV